MVRGRAMFAVLVFAGLGLIMAGCSSLQSTSGGGGENYFPHAQGNTWRHPSTDGSSQVMTVEGTTSVGSITVQKFSSCYHSASGYTSTSEAYYKIDGSGVYSHGSPNYPSSVGIPFIVFPLDVGKTWDVIISGSTSAKATVVSKENVTVPAGTFDCYKVSYSSTYMNYVGSTETNTSTVWFGNNAGIVKSTTSNSTVETVLEWKNF